MFWLLTVKDCKGPNTVHHPKCIRTQEFPLLKGIRILRPLAVLCRVLCSKHNIILKWRIALRARASLVQNVERGLSSHSQTSLDQAEKSSGRTARHRSVGKNLSSRLVRRGFSRYPYHCLNGAISTVQTCAKARLGARVHEGLTFKPLVDQW